MKILDEFYNERKKNDDSYSFIAGFRLGVQMTAESLSDET